MHELGAPMKTDSGKYIAYSTVTLQPLADFEFDSEEAANKYIQDRSFRFGLKLDDSLNQHAESDAAFGRKNNTKFSTVQHSTSLLDGE